MLTELTYNHVDYVFKTDPEDPSGYGCIREIILNDEYELSRFRNYSKSIFDIGANCGVATTILAKQNPNTQIYSFEPFPPTYQLLLENIKLNNISNVKVFNCAVGKAGRNSVTLHLHPEFSGGNTICSSQEPFEEFHLSPAKSITVPCISLDEIIHEQAVERIDLLKIDCEGSEFEILLHSEQLRKGIVRNIVGEFHDLVYNSEVSEKSEDLLAYCDEHIQGIKKISVLKL